jgi:hypothetical protein
MIVGLLKPDQGRIGEDTAFPEPDRSFSADLLNLKITQVGEARIFFS